jgi:hypothetical protein
MAKEYTNPRPSKINPNWDFGFEIIPSGIPVSDSKKQLLIYGDGALPSEGKNNLEHVFIFFFPFR